MRSPEVARKEPKTSIFHADTAMAKNSRRVPIDYGITITPDTCRSLNWFAILRTGPLLRDMDRTIYDDQSVAAPLRNSFSIRPFERGRRAGSQR